jgi:hypothetical protein
MNGKTTRAIPESSPLALNLDQVPELQREVQRLLGRCMLRLQQYERLMKSILVRHTIAGSVGEIETNGAARIEAFADKTLGTLVKALFESFVVVEGSDLPVNEDARTGAGRASFNLRFGISMSDVQRAQTKSAVEEVVKLRNELVHHLIERFDVQGIDGCKAASRYLMQSYDRINMHYEQLHQWASGMVHTRALAANFLQSEGFEDLVVSGIAPDSSFDWPNTGIVRVLREAAEELSEAGWTLLDRAKRWVAEHHPEQLPAKYGCRTWPQVLSESKLFEIRYLPCEDGRKVGWYRNKPHE